MSGSESDRKIDNHSTNMAVLGIWNSEMTHEWFVKYQKNHSGGLPILTKNPKYICVCDWCLRNSDLARREMLMRINVETMTYHIINRANQMTKEKNDGKET